MKKLHNLTFVQINISIVLFYLCIALGCSSTPVQKPAPLPMETKPSSNETEGRNWVRSESTDPMDGTKQVVLIADAVDGSGGSLIIRFKGRKLDVYVNTDEIVDDESASVRIKFDDGDPVIQTWGRSTSYKSVFAPNPFSLLMRLQRAKKFYIEYKPYQRVPETIIFNASGLSAALPEAQMAEQKKKHEESEAASAALRSRVSPHVRLCSDQSTFPGLWCWSDPNDPLFSSETGWQHTKEEAIRDAMEMARSGMAFKK